MGGAGPGNRRRQGQASRAPPPRLQDPHRVEARPGPDRAHPQCRPAGVHRPGTGSGLAAAAGPAVGQREDRTPASRATSKPAASCRASTCRRKLDRAEGDVHASGNPHIQLNPHNIAAGQRRAGQAPGRRSIRPMRAYYQARQADFAGALERGDAQVGKAGRAAARRGRGRAPQEHGIPDALAGHAPGRHARSRSPASSRARPSWASCWRSCSASRPGWCCARPTRTSAPRSGCRSAPAFRRSCCRSRSAADAQSRRPVRPVRHDRAAPAGSEQMSADIVRLDDRAAGLSGRPAGAGHPHPARRPGAQARDRVHRPGDRPDRRAGRDRRRFARPRPARLDGAGGGRRGRACSAPCC